MGSMAALLPARASANATTPVGFEPSARIQCWRIRTSGTNARTLGTVPNNWRSQMILRIDRWQTELPPPSDPDPDGASIVQELMGGKFGEMSTLMNYTFQSFNFRNRQGARPFYDLIANIAAEEYGHIELVAAAINTMLTGSERKGARPRNTQQFIAGGKSALPQDSMGKPWTGDYVTATGDLVEDLTHNFFLETGARNNKLKVYEKVDHPAAPAPSPAPPPPRGAPPGRPPARP